MNIKPIKFYHPLEEKINIITHAIGIALSVVALVLLVVFASIYGTVWHIVSFSIYGASLLALYSASTIYHSIQNPKWRYRFNIVDHSAIYILIAGTYTPFTLVTLNGTIGWVMFGVTWGIAAIGIIFKIFFTGRFDIVSTIAYVAMGWIVIFAINPLINNLPANGLIWLFLGGIFYTIGAVIYAIQKIKFNHAIFHIFVLLGSFSHFLAVFFYVLP
ncbi:MAG: hemolysin III family protein [Flavobacteriaceae bacterium]|jgi:hemolysin III|nr:hemolysin III family protein [Flavobacteriaceae bacterium]